jgi:RNA-directed DNA polymerase
VDDVRSHLFVGKTDVIDADISKYFDTIPHDQLMQLVAKRIEKMRCQGIFDGNLIIPAFSG